MKNVTVPTGKTHLTVSFDSKVFDFLVPKLTSEEQTLLLKKIAKNMSACPVFITRIYKIDLTTQNKYNYIATYDDIVGIVEEVIIDEHDHHLDNITIEEINDPSPFHLPKEFSESTNQLYTQHFITSASRLQQIKKTIETIVYNEDHIILNTPPLPPLAPKLLTEITEDLPIQLETLLSLKENPQYQQGILARLLQKENIISRNNEIQTEIKQTACLTAEKVDASIQAINDLGSDEALTPKNRALLQKTMQPEEKILTEYVSQKIVAQLDAHNTTELITNTFDIHLDQIREQLKEIDYGNAKLKLDYIKNYLLWMLYHTARLMAQAVWTNPNLMETTTDVLSSYYANPSIMERRRNALSKLFSKEGVFTGAIVLRDFAQLSSYRAFLQCTINHIALQNFTLDSLVNFITFMLRRDTTSVLHQYLSTETQRVNTVLLEQLGFIPFEFGQRSRVFALTQMAKETLRSFEDNKVQINKIIDLCNAVSELEAHRQSLNPSVKVDIAYFSPLIENIHVKYQYIHDQLLQQQAIDELFRQTTESIDKYELLYDRLEAEITSHTLPVREEQNIITGYQLKNRQDIDILFSAAKKLDPNKNKIGSSSPRKPRLSWIEMVEKMLSTHHQIIAARKLHLSHLRQTISEFNTHEIMQAYDLALQTEPVEIDSDQSINVSANHSVNLNDIKLVTTKLQEQQKAIEETLKEINREEAESSITAELSHLTKLVNTAQRCTEILQKHQTKIHQTTTYQTDLPLYHVYSQFEEYLESTTKELSEQHELVIKYDRIAGFDFKTPLSDAIQDQIELLRLENDIIEKNILLHVLMNILINLDYWSHIQEKSKVVVTLQEKSYQVPKLIADLINVLIAEEHKGWCNTDNANATTIVESVLRKIVDHSKSAPTFESTELTILNYALANLSTPLTNILSCLFRDNALPKDAKFINPASLQSIRIATKERKTTTLALPEIQKRRLSVPSTVENLAENENHENFILHEPIKTEENLRPIVIQITKDSSDQLLLRPDRKAETSVVIFNQPMEITTSNPSSFLANYAKPMLFTGIGVSLLLVLGVATGGVLPIALTTIGIGGTLGTAIVYGGVSFAGFLTGATLGLLGRKLVNACVPKKERFNVEDAPLLEQRNRSKSPAIEMSDSTRFMRNQLAVQGNFSRQDSQPTFIVIPPQKEKAWDALHESLKNSFKESHNKSSIKHTSFLEMHEAYKPVTPSVTEVTSTPINKSTV